MCLVITSFTNDVSTFSIRITFNVNHTVDTEAETEKAEIGELKSKPSFKIELINGDTTVRLLCSFIDPEEAEEEYSMHTN